MTPFLRRRLLPLMLALAAGHALAQSDGKAARFYEDALKRYERRDLAGAIIQLKNAQQIDASLLPVHVLMGKALLAQGEAANAAIELNEALRLGVNRAEVVVPLTQAMIAEGKQSQMLAHPQLRVAGLPAETQLQLLLLRAAAYTDLGDSRSAMRAIEDARSIHPNSAATWLGEVPVRLRANQLREALAAADQALELAPDSAEAVYQKATVLHVQGLTREALAQYDRALKIDARHLEARMARAALLLDLGRDKDAQADLAWLRSVAPGDPRPNYLRALLAERAGDATAARAALRAVTERLDPVPIESIRYRPQALMLNGMAHFGLNEFEEAKPYLEYALRHQANTPLAKLLAHIAIAEGAYGRANELLEAYLRVHGGDGQALLMLASTQMAQGRHAKATALMQEALRAKDDPRFRTALGLSLMRSGQASGAIAELEKAFKTDPRQPYTGLALVDVYLRSGQTAKAQGIADALVKINPGNASVLVVQGLAKTRARDYAGARLAYEAALRLDPQQLEARLGLARVDILSRDFESARKRLNAVLKDNDSNIDARYEMAVLHEVWGSDEEALKWLEAAVEASGANETRANFALVAWHLRKGQAAKALNAAKLLLAKLPEDVSALQAYARAQIANGNAAGARSTLTIASRRAAFDAAAQVEIAAAQMQLRDLAGAAYSLDKALTASPDYLPAMALMTSLELAQNEAAKAERRARQIIAQHPKLAVGHALLADVAGARGQPAAAIESLRRAHEIEPNSQTLLRLFAALARQDNGKPAIELAERWMRTHAKDFPVQKALADAQARSGNYAAARRSYEAALQLRPSDAEAMNNLANVLLRQKDPGALKVAEKALALAPYNPLVIDTAGWANHIAGNMDKALTLLRDARLREPNNPEIRYHLATVLAKAGRKSEAREELQAALRAPNFEGIQDARSLLSTLE
ncbi:XrtA/PEP-CTERM system TPR-repeat protein PrsT [Roseateles violae]|uniref:PEP-CTERM system TPR-repeat protein PrsT n=1 Tax=Roseateles violae TaxID=3058042 RepID=A0ABT8DVF6_9BURK|nr:XrtA/PEP-CTERM system TPR-repeat protein PrsT [Pelomonas sp. PFR6]MDN3920131.1 PEP-CTERM system TPR-repeat protein PrsT [Pelomonas sp. PFR6]